ncbi:MAG: hypothetical protein JWL79_3130 [Frankiales bacterium]|jgi:hypothetical protein|nr:hypothetical protein [Frankiales bacterium]
MNDRIEQFKAQVADMGLRDPAAARDRLLLRASAALLAAGPIVGLIAYLMSHSSSDALAQRDAIVLALLGVGLSVVGTALFVRYSLGQVLRFWLARLTFEQAAQTDRVVEALAVRGDGEHASKLAAPRRAR